MYDTSGSQRSRPAITDARNAPVTVYGTGWCAATQMVRRHLDRLDVPYSYRDMDRDPSATAQVRWWTGGYTSHPTVQIGGQVLIEPNTTELRWALHEAGLI